jgi:formylglycine-generating enzyme required for sulfatase activity
MKRTLLLLVSLPVFILGCGAPSGSPEGSPQTFETGVDPEAWVLVPAGEFMFGLHGHETMVEDDYEIMITTVTNAQYAHYLNKALVAGAIKIVDDQVVGYYPGDEFHGYRHEEEIAAGDWLHIAIDEPGLRLNYLGDRFTSMEGYQNRPMVQVTWFGAKSYCEFNGGRLPTEMEWEKAARGTDGRAFPWGDQISQENANYYSSHDIFEKIVGGLGDTSPVGFYNGETYNGFKTIDSPSPYGLYDMAGNVWQWTGDVYEGAHYRYMRGGSKADYGYNLRVWTRNNASPDYFSPNVGFRCVRTPGEG